MPKSEICSKNCVNDPINPGIGNVYTTEEEDVAFSGNGTIRFRRESSPYFLS
jgi:hypothetical protein